MPKLARKLTQAEIKQITKEGIYSTGHQKGLCVQVHRAGDKEWVFRYRKDGRLIIIKIGGLEFLSLKEAEDEAINYRRCLELGGDPAILNMQIKRRRLMQLYGLDGKVDPEELDLLSPAKMAFAKAIEHDNSRVQSFFDKAKEVDNNGKEVGNKGNLAASTTSQPSPDGVPYTAKHAAYDFIDYLEQNNYFSNNSRGKVTLEAYLQNHIFPVIDPNKPFAEVTANEMCTVLNDKWLEHPSLAAKLQSFLVRWFKWGVANGKYHDAAYKLNLDYLTEISRRNQPEGSHNPCLDYKLMPDFMLDLWRMGRSSIAALCFMFSILTCTRSKAVRLLQWSQINLQEAVWEIPIGNDKSKKRNRLRTIMLSPQALKLLSVVRQGFGSGTNNTSDYVFFSARTGSYLSESCFTQIINRLNDQRIAIGATPLTDPNITDSHGRPRLVTQHGTARSSFKTWTKSDELGNYGQFNEEAVELCLLHERKDPLKGAYDRSTLDLERRRVMQAWGDYCCSKIPELNRCGEDIE